MSPFGLSTSLCTSLDYVSAGVRLIVKKMLKVRRKKKKKRKERKRKSTQTRLQGLLKLVLLRQLLLASRAWNFTRQPRKQNTRYRRSLNINTDLKLGWTVTWRTAMQPEIKVARFEVISTYLSLSNGKPFSITYLTLFYDEYNISSQLSHHLNIGFYPFFHSRSF